MDDTGFNRVTMEFISKTVYTPVNQHTSNGKWTIGRCIAYIRWGCSIAMLVYRRAPLGISSEEKNRVHTFAYSLHVGLCTFARAPRHRNKGGDRQCKTTEKRNIWHRPFKLFFVYDVLPCFSWMCWVRNEVPDHPAQKKSIVG